MGLKDLEILKIFGEHITSDKRGYENPKPQFNLNDLVEKTISVHRRIKNPRQFNSEWTSPNPEFYDVLEFSDGAILLSEQYSAA